MSTSASKTTNSSPCWDRAGWPRAGLGGGAEGVAYGRTVRRARRADRADPAGGAHSHLGTDAHHRGVRHPQHGRGGPPRRSHRAHQRATGHRRRRHPRPASPAALARHRLDRALRGVRRDPLASVGAPPRDAARPTAPGNRRQDRVVTVAAKGVRAPATGWFRAPAVPARALPPVGGALGWGALGWVWQGPFFPPPGGVLL